MHEKEGPKLAATACSNRLPVPPPAAAAAAAVVFPVAEALPDGIVSWVHIEAACLQGNLHTPSAAAPASRNIVSKAVLMSVFILLVRLLLLLLYLYLVESFPDEIGAWVHGEDPCIKRN